jgi:hypothetical protein
MSSQQNVSAYQGAHIFSFSSEEQTADREPFPPGSLARVGIEQRS